MGNLQCTPKQDINQAVQSKRDIGDKFYKGRVAERVFKLLYNALSINFETHSDNFFYYNDSGRISNYSCIKG